MVQIIFDSLIRASELSLLAVGLTMVYSVLRFPNFSHVEFATVGAYVALFLSAGAGMNLVPAAAIAIVLTGVLGVACDRLIFSRLRKSAPVMLMITGFALGIAMRETVRAIWGPSPFFFEIGVLRPWEVVGARITPFQLAIILAAVVAMFTFYLLLTRTTLGVAMRATADNAELSQASGIHTERVIRAVWFIGSGFAALGGVLIGLSTQLKPDMGFGLIIEVFCAAIVGGIGHPFGAMLGAVLVGFAENIGLAINWAPLLDALGLTAKAHVYVPTGYKAAIPFSLLILTLLLRPRGILGVKR
ncbi:MAG: branched-chain amino acid ABC transporter permease [Alphaproteobacteria bacterium]